MFSLLTNFNLVLGGAVIAFAAGVVLSTKVKDFFKGIPAQARAALNNVEADTIAKIRGAQAQVLAQLPSAPAAKAPLAPAPVAPAQAPVATAPAQAPVAPAAKPDAPAA